MGFLENLFGPKKPIIKAEDLCKKYLNNILSAEKRSFYIETLTKLMWEYKELKGINAQKYIEEITALHIEILTFAWVQACLRGVLPPKHRDAMVIATLSGSDSRLEKYEPLIEAYNRAVGRSANLPTGDAVREVTSTLLERVGIKGASEELIERLYNEFGALFNSMFNGLKLWKLE